MDKGAEYYRRYLDGDDDAIAELIRDYMDGLLLYINEMTGNISLAEEFMEDAFFKLVTRKPRFRGKSKFKTWLYAIGRNAAIDGMRKRSRLSDLSPEDCGSISDEENIERNYLREEQKIHLHRVMSRLNPDYRQVLYLTFFEGLSNGEAAEVMKKSRRQIEQLLYRAKLSLRSELEKEGFEYEVL
ncbi:MAG: RNA polymerase sigma factor [Ruminococcus sp.]|nr:RNA polymerase sigma factor [Ruminococcus sp.]